MAANMQPIVRLWFRQKGCRGGITAASGRLVTGHQVLHTYHRRQDPLSSRGTSSQAGPGSLAGSSSSYSSQSAAGPSITNIFLATAAIIIATPYALDLYGRATGTTSLRSTLSSKSGKLEPYNHRPFPLISSSYYPEPDRASVHKLLHIGVPASVVGSDVRNEDKLKQLLRVRSIYIKEPSLVIERAYTPLYDTLPGSYSMALVGASAEEKQRVDLLVKRYPDGELGKMLHRAVPNPAVPQIEVRGPVDTWSFERDSAASGEIPDRIVMIVGGTGITPAYQLLTNLFGRPCTSATSTAVSGSPKIDVLYATPNLENALLLPQLHALASANKDKLSVSLFSEKLAGSPSALSPAELSALGPQLTASSSGRSWLSSLWGKSRSALDPQLRLTSSQSPTTTIPVYESRIVQQHIEQLLSPIKQQQKTGRTLILVSGPDGMVEAIAGPKSRDGQHQGSLSGMLAKIGWRQEDVFKL